MWSVNSLYTSAFHTAGGRHFILGYSPPQCKVSILNSTLSLSSDLFFEYSPRLSQNGAMRTKWASGFSPTRGEASQAVKLPEVDPGRSSGFFFCPHRWEIWGAEVRWAGAQGTLLEFGRPGILSSWGHLGTYFTVLMEQFLAFFPFDFHLLAVCFSSSFTDIIDIRHWVTVRCTV